MSISVGFKSCTAVSNNSFKMLIHFFDIAERKPIQLLRIDVESEVKGVDVAEFDGLAYINEIHSETQDNVKENTISSV